MKKIFSLALTAMLVFLVGASFTSCNCEDINSADTDWIETPTGPILTGTVRTTGGALLANAKITIALSSSEVLTTTTDSKGRYTFSGNLKAGDFDVDASYPADSTYTTSDAVVNLQNDKITIWNTILYPKSTKTDETFTPDGTVYSVYLPNIVAKDTVETTQIASYYVPYDALEEGDKLQLSAWYDLDNVANAPTRAKDYKYTGYDVVVVTEAKSEYGATTTKTPIMITCNGLINPSKIIHCGKEVTEYYNYTTPGTDSCYTYFYTTELGRTEFYYPIYKSEVEYGQVEVQFSPNEFTGYTKTEETSYKECSGSDIVFQNNFLDQYVVMIEGSTELDVYDVNMTFHKTIPEGEKAIIYGYQEFEEYTYKCGWAEVPVVWYGSISHSWKDRVHTGGSD